MTTLEILTNEDPVEVPVFRTKTKGLVVNRTLDTLNAKGRNVRWNITHASSGMKVNNFPFARKTDAIACANALGLLTDWTQDDGSLFRKMQEDLQFKDTFHKTLRFYLLGF